MQWRDIPSLSERSSRLKVKALARWMLLVCESQEDTSEMRVLRK